MGKVFSWSEIVEGKVPEQQSFANVAKTVRRELKSADGVVGGIICGSILWNNWSKRSDLDCVVVYDPEKRRDVVMTLQEINRFATGLYVPVEMIPLDTSIIKTPMHHIRYSFMVHLRHAIENGGLIKEDLLALFSFDGITAIEDVCGYVRNKLRTVEKGANLLPTMSDPDRCRFLQKVLEAPMHIARKMLWLEGVELLDDRKQTVAQHYATVAGAREHELFEKVLAVDERYTAELHSQLQHPARDRYLRAIEEIQELVWDTLEFVRLNAFRLAKTCNA